jgi:flavin-dependent dehydrogenase
VRAFLTDARHVPRSAGGRQRFFAEQLQATTLIRGCFGVAVAGHIRVAPANSSIRLDLNGSDWVAVGDAAAAYDPLAGLGVVAALSKGSAIARLLLREPSTVSAANRYAELEQLGFRNYLAGRRAIYGGQDRWKDRSFWQQRVSQSQTLDHL